MMWKLFTGLRGGPDLPFSGAFIWDLLLLLQFPLLHSLLLTPRGGRMLARLTPARIGNELRTTTFALTSSLQLLLVFLLWAPLGPVWFRVQGPALAVCVFFYAGGWVLLLKSMADAGLGVQTGSLGWWAVFRNRPVDYPPWRERGTLRTSRHPMYLAYTLLLWSGPVWTPDHLLIASLWTVYCVTAPLHKESRYRKRYGASFENYRQRVPYFLPRFRNPNPRVSR
jgi:protein-S-isoprenylcysteine O-methyltransferase Ste14